MNSILKKTAILFILVSSSLLQAQDFKPYKVKSGKIVYEKIKYKMHVGFKYENGVETSFSEQIPYVEKYIIYYWDNFGDIAFEETFQVSEFGGKPLPEKIKISERLWIGDHRYYFNIEKNKVSDDPYYVRIKCKENFQYYHIKDSWVETLYMGVEKNGTYKLLGKEANYYHIDNYHDLYVWKGLILKDESFSTKGSNGARNTIERAKIALEINTNYKINKNLFSPIWLKELNRTKN